MIENTRVSNPSLLNNRPRRVRVIFLPIGSTDRNVGEPQFEFPLISSLLPETSCAEETRVTWSLVSRL